MRTERRPVIFISYSHRDAKIKDRLLEHISILGDTEFELWDDSQIQTGDDWRRKIDEGLARADAGILLISTDFLTSRFVKTVEVPALLAKRLFPVLIGYCAWDQVPWLAKLQIETDNGKPLGTRGQKLDKGLLEVAKKLALLYAPQEAAPAPARRAPPPPPAAGAAPPLHVDVSDPYVAIVIVKDQRIGPTFNLRLRIVNEEGTAVTLRTLRIVLTDPHGSVFNLHWTVFFGGDEVHRSIGDAHPFELPPWGRQVIGIQFAGPPSIAHYQWVQGRYTCDLIGRTAERGPDAVLRRWEMTLTATNAGDLFFWARAGSAQWEALDDPDNAVGIPVTITSRSSQ